MPPHPVGAQKKLTVKHSRKVQATNLYTEGKKLLATAAFLGVGLLYPILTLTSAARAQTGFTYTNQASVEYQDPITETTFAATSGNPITTQLVDPLGRVTGCGGETLPSYEGFSVALYETANGIDLGALIRLTPTEVPDIPGNGVPVGVFPNTQNSNPYFLSNSTNGRYSFLLDDAKGQLALGQTYILLINPAIGSNFRQRRVAIKITGRTGNTVSYTATSLDGAGLATDPGATTLSESLTVGDAGSVGLTVSFQGLQTCVGPAQALQINKTGDRVAAEPGDTVVYRVSVRNLISAPVSNIVLMDTLPLGFNFLENSVRAGADSTPIAGVTSQRNGATVTFTVPGLLPAGSTLTVVYAALLTPDAIRGSGVNSAVAQGQGPRGFVKDGPATYKVRVRAGILSDGGTVIGRVFVDKNFDGEQQADEPGMPNAVVFLEDGTRITTDPKGLFSVPNVLPGAHTGVLDLSSLPGYTLAPNLYFIERNSQSRLVRMAPGGLARMNFGVTPAFGGAKP
jgi:uncharacterized repeat protein (TIGR01451 family)